MAHTSIAPNQGWDERIIRIDCGTQVSAHLIATRRYLIVVDTLLHPAAGAELREHALAFGRPLLVVTTHADWDHYFGNQVFHDQPILGTRGCVERVAVDGPIELARKRSEDEALYGSVRLTPPTLSFEGELVIDGGDLTVRCLPSPGHRRDHIALWIAQLRTLLPGDNLELPVPITDDDPSQLPVLHESLTTLKALDPVWTLANHAPPCPGSAQLEDNLGYLEALREGARRVRAGASPSMEQACPYRWPEAADFYREEHARACAAALQWPD